MLPPHLQRISKREFVLELFKKEKISTEREGGGRGDCKRQREPEIFLRLEEGCGTLTKARLRLANGGGTAICRSAKVASGTYSHLAYLHQYHVSLVLVPHPSQSDLHYGRPLPRLHWHLRLHATAPSWQPEQLCSPAVQLRDARVPG